MSSTILGTRLERLRKERGFSLEDVQKIIHAQTGRLFTEKFLEQAEYTPDDMPLEHVAWIAGAYNVSLIDLLIGSGYDRQPPGKDAEDTVLKEWDGIAEHLAELLEASSSYLTGTAKTLQRLQAAETRRRAQIRAQAAFSEEHGS